MGTLFTRLNECGVGGDITIAFENGTYLGHIDLSAIAGTMGNHNLTLTSVTKNRDNVTIADNINPIRAILNIGSNNKNITVEHLTFTLLQDTNCAIIYLEGGCSDILIRNNRLIMDTNASDGSLIGGGFSATAGCARNVTIVSNLLQGGLQGINLRGKGSAEEDLLPNFVADNNEMIHQKTNAINLQYFHVTSISHNVILSRCNNNNNFTGIRLYIGQADSIIGNYIDATRDTINQLGTNGLYLYYLNYYNGTSTLVANNCILSKSFASYSGVYAYSSSFNLYNNTIRTLSAKPNQNNGHSLYIYRNAKMQNHVYGNILDAINNEGAIFINNNPNMPTKMDYNDYCNTGSYLASVNSNKYYKIADIQAALQTDSHSVSVTPAYKDLKKNLAFFANSQLLMPRLDEVKMDIEGKPRASFTAMGAYENESEKNDAALYDFSKTVLTKGISSPVYVSLLNLGSDPLTSITIQWIANGVSQTPVNWTGNLTSRTSTDVLLGNIIPTKNNTLVAWVEKPNSQNDPNHTNDTIRLQKYLCDGKLSGN